jgi:hypothetical protein
MKIVSLVQPYLYMQIPKGFLATDCSIRKVSESLAMTSRKVEIPHGRRGLHDYLPPLPCSSPVDQSISLTEPSPVLPDLARMDSAVSRTPAKGDRRR